MMCRSTACRAPTQMITGNMENKLYEEKLKTMHDNHESICRRCGLCCGLKDNDPCSHLIKNTDGTFFCGIYHDRLGERQTVSGRIFKCVAIKDLLMLGGTHQWCAYNCRYLID